MDMRTYSFFLQNKHTQDYGSQLRSLGDSEGRFVLLVHLTFDPESAVTSLLDEDLLRLHSVRQREVEYCTIFVGFLGKVIDR